MVPLTPRMCKNGHNVCDLCKTARASKCPVCQDNVMDISNAELEALIKHFKAPISCKYGEAGCDETNVLDEILLHEEDCHFRPIKCLVVYCKADIRLNGLDNHVTEKHQEMMDGKWVIRKTPAPPTAIRTWRHSDVRFFATLFLGGDGFWHIMVSGACGKNMAAKFRAEIRLTSQDLPECSNVYHRPLEHLETNIVLNTMTMKHHTACLDVHKIVLESQTKGKVTSLQIEPEDIPFTCHVYEKVFVTFDKEDIEEKED